MHNCPQGSSKSKICCWFGRRKGQCFQRAYSISLILPSLVVLDSHSGIKLSDEPSLFPEGWRETLRQQRPRQGLIARRTKRAFTRNYHIISADKQWLQSKYTHVNQHTQKKITGLANKSVKQDKDLRQMTCSN